MMRRWKVEPYETGYLNLQKGTSLATTAPWRVVKDRGERKLSKVESGSVKSPKQRLRPRTNASRRIET